MTADPIVTLYDPPPIPIRLFDWSARLASYSDPGDPLGYGRTEAEAIADLKEQIEERRP